MTIEQTLSEFLCSESLTKMDISADGYCLLRAVETVLRVDELKNISMDEIKHLIRVEIADNLEEYKAFYPDDVALRKTFNEQLNSYLDRGNYNSEIGDFMIGAMCNALHI